MRGPPVCASAFAHRPTHALSLLPLHSAERGLSNYLVYYTSKTDAKVAKHAKDVGSYADVPGEGLVRVDVAPTVVQPSRRQAAPGA